MNKITTLDFYFANLDFCEEAINYNSEIITLKKPFKRFILELEELDTIIKLSSSSVKPKGIMTSYNASATCVGLFRPTGVYFGEANTIPLVDSELQTVSIGKMTKYSLDEKATCGLLMKDKGIRTGNKGIIDGDGFLKLTDRSKELLKIPRGKFVGSAHIESSFLYHALVELAAFKGWGCPQLQVGVLFRMVRKGRSKIFQTQFENKVHPLWKDFNDCNF